MADIPARLQALRARMAGHDLDSYLVPSADEHLNEYLPLHRARREWLSGFTGSAGDLLVGKEEAWLFADGRYHLQADRELEGSGITPVKLGKPGVKNLLETARELATTGSGYRLGVDPMVIPVSFGKSLAGNLGRGGGVLVDVSGNLVDADWRNRPEPSRSRLMALDPAWTGATATEKLQRLRADLAEAGAESTVIVKLDQIAWLLNLRSLDDIPYNPVFESFLCVTPDDVRLFLRGAEARLPADWRERPADLVVHDYKAFADTLKTLGGHVLVDTAATTRGVVGILKDAGCTLVRELSPAERRKGDKNAAEQEAQRRANLRASVAKTRALLWLEQERAQGRAVTEAGFRSTIEGLYAEQEGYFGLSFNTIAATGAHGAIIHYGACDETPLRDGELFLIDSGAHIAGGTTDDTRTVAVGEPDEEARRLFTLVLKGHVACARQVFPEGSSGAALDALTRSPLWNAGLNYDHGTGHGVGTFLNVHEGPFSISERERKAASQRGLQAGMVTSVEPGYYREGWGGIRIENLYLLQPAEDRGDGRKWLQMDPLTWVPLDERLIDRSLLSPEECAWLDTYQSGCVERLAPHLSDDERARLSAMSPVPGSTS